jgi:UDP-N-acetylmuramoyl-L-alanyl-D-glutamate--2,6-diaminopimelate ligase
MEQLKSVNAAMQWLRHKARLSAHLSVDSRKLNPGDVFIAWPGAAHDGRRFAASALDQGAAACLMEEQGSANFASEDSRVATLPGLKASLGDIASEWYGHPSREMDVIAVTGTNGKTSTTWWLSQALGSPALAQPVKTGVVGTLGVGIAPHVEPTGLTTPDPVMLHRTLRDFVQQGVGACAMEASSIGLEEERMAGLAIRVAVFTNFTQDHLDYHGSMAAYWQAKARLFAWPGLQAVVLNADASQTQALIDSLPPEIEVWTYGLHQAARLQAKNVSHTAQGMRFEVHEGSESVDLHTQAIGDFNVANLLAVIGSLRALGHPLAQAVKACEGLLPVPGRLQCVGGDAQPLACVDYAHTPDALEKVLQTLRPVAVARGGQLWCLFGCGGNRDATKRPLMAAVAERHADRVMVTSDNPRDEDPRQIISQILIGLANSAAAEVDVDRRSAIAHVLAQAQAQDVVLLAGKGHEDYQEVSGAKSHFSDLEEAARALAQRLPKNERQAA